MSILTHLKKLGVKVHKSKVASSEYAEKSLALAERYFGTAFPADYRKFLGAFFGSVTFENSIVFVPDVKSPWDSKVDGTQSLQILYGLEPGKDDILKINKMYIGRIPMGTLVIGEAPGGNQILLDLKNKSKILFWDHDDEVEIVGNRAIDYRNTYLIKPKFSDFIKSLNVQVETKPRNLDHVKITWSKSFLKKLPKSFLKKKKL